MGLIESLKGALAEGQEHYWFDQNKWCGTKTRAVVISPLAHKHCSHGHHHLVTEADAYAEAIVHAVLSTMTPSVDPKKPHTLALATSDALIIFAEGPMCDEAGVLAAVHIYHYDAMKTMKKKSRQVALTELTGDLERFTRRRYDPLFGANVEKVQKTLASIAELFVEHWRNTADGEDQVDGDEGQPAGDLGGDGGESVDVHPPDGGEGPAGGGSDGPAPK